MPSAKTLVIIAGVVVVVLIATQKIAPVKAFIYG
jgi:hypothetical protein